MDRGRPLKKRLGAPSSASSALYPPSWSRALNQGTASAPIRVALLAADPAMPHGQLWDLRHVFRSEQPNPLLQTHVERELPHAAAVEWMESYDALCASVELHTSCVRLVRVFASWAPLREALVSSLAPSFNVLWAGSWLFLALGVYEVRHGLALLWMRGRGDRCRYPSASRLDTPVRPCGVGCASVRRGVRGARSPREPRLPFFLSWPFFFFPVLCAPRGL